MAHGYPDYTFFAYPVNVPAGGTGLTTVPIGALIVGNGIGNMTPTSVGSADQVLRIPHAGGLPDFGAINLAAAAAVSGLLPVANGGTGTTTPALVQGSNITISGTWPAQTVALVASPVLGTAVNSYAGAAVIGGLTDPNGKHLFLDGFLWIACQAGAAPGGGWGIYDTLGQNPLTVLIDGTQTVILGIPLAVTSGGTGQGTCSAGQLLIGSGSNTAAWGTPPGARVYNDAAESIPNLTATALTFDQERYNNGAMHSTGTKPSRLTASQSGVYMLTGHAQFANNATGYRSIQIWLNASTIIAQHDFLSLINQAQNMSIATLWHLSATDYVELRVVQTSGGALNIVAAADSSPEFAAQWLGP